MKHVRLIKPRFVQRLVQCILDIGGSHARAKFPSDDVSAVVVQDGRQVKPTPADGLEIGEVCLPIARQAIWLSQICREGELIGCCRLVSELISRFYDDDVGAGNQIMRSKKPVNAGF